MLANKIKPKILKIINKFPATVDIFRNNLNEFNEPKGEEFICNITGFYHEGNNSITAIAGESGKIKREKQKFLMVICDEITSKIKENDYFELDSVRYRIIDLGNQNRLNIYFDMLLEVM